MQERLIELQFLTGKADGDFGKGTQAAVKAFQEMNGLSADGVAGEQTLSVLYDQSAKRQQWVWIQDGSGTKYHSNSSCSQMKTPRKVTITEAASLGFEPCGKCY